MTCGLIHNMEILLAGGSTKPAKDLKVGDKLETLHQHTFVKGEHEVSYFRVVESPLLDLIFSNKTFKCSEEDLFYSPSKESWVKATELEKGDKVSQLDGELEFESSKKLGKGKSIELTVEGAHTYVCDGVLLHNKGRKSKGYSQADVDAMKKQWHADAKGKYEKRLAGDKSLWEAQRDRDKAIWEKDYSDQQRTLYDERFKTAKADWRDRAKKRYDERFATAKDHWHTAAEQRYDDRFTTAQDQWQTAADQVAAAKEADWQTKYGTLEDDWTKKYEGQATNYDEKLRQEKAAFRHENEQRLDLLDRYNTLEGNYADRGREYGDLEGRYGDLEKDYRKKGKKYSTLEGQYSDLDKRYGLLTGDYGDLEGRYGALEKDYRKRGAQYDTLTQDYENLQERGRGWGESRPGEAYIQVEGPGNPSWESRNPRPERDVHVPMVEQEPRPPRQVPGGSSRRPLADDAERYALLTGDYSGLNQGYR